MKEPVAALLTLNLKLWNEKPLPIFTYQQSEN